MIPNDKTTREQRLGVGFEVEKWTKKDIMRHRTAYVLGVITVIALAWAFVSLYFLTFSH